MAGLIEGDRHLIHAHYRGLRVALKESEAVASTRVRKR